MPGSNKEKKPDVLSHWYTLVDYFNISSEDFYRAILQDVHNRNVPGLKMYTVSFSEGGFLSAKRIYLRMKRERLVFDICAAPFGTSYFFSMRFAELPPGAAWWRWLPLLAGMAGGVSVFADPSHRAPYFLIIAALGIIGAMIVVWIVIRLIEEEFRKESYYRQDTRLMYLEIINTVVKQKVAEFTSAKGICLLDIRQHSPLMDNIYRTTQVNIQPLEMPAPPLPEPVAA